METRKTSSRRPAMASATTSSAPPSAYISAVSISVMPEVEAEPQRRRLARPVGAALPHMPGALAEGRDLRAIRQPHKRHSAISRPAGIIPAMLRTATLAFALLPLAAQAQPPPSRTRRSAAGASPASQDRMTDRAACALRHRDWVEKPSAGTPGLALEVIDRRRPAGSRGDRARPDDRGRRRAACWR